MVARKVFPVRDGADGGVLGAAGCGTGRRGWIGPGTGARPTRGRRRVGVSRSLWMMLLRLLNDIGDDAGVSVRIRQLSGFGDANGLAILGNLNLGWSF